LTSIYFTTIQIESLFSHLFISRRGRQRSRKKLVSEIRVFNVKVADTQTVCDTDRRHTDMSNDINKGKAGFSRNRALVSKNVGPLIINTLPFL